MTSVVRSILGAALLVTGVSSAMAASGTAPVVDKSNQTAASTAVVASTTAAVAAPSPLQAGAPTAAPANAAAAPVAAAPQKRPRANFSDNTDPYGGNDPNSTAGARAFFVPQY